MPEQVTAGNSAAIHFAAYSGYVEATGEYWIYLEVNEGSYGGRFGKDAMDSVDNLMVNTRNNPIEELDMRFPMRCERYELRDEPAAPGRWRGGIGIVRENRFLVEGTFSSESDRCYDPPRGIFGGHNGAVQRVTKGAGSDAAELIPAKVTGLPFAAGESVRIEVPNGAGYGDPLDRDPEAVRDDVLDDFTTVDLARSAYGVVFENEVDFKVDADATEKARASLRSGG